MQAVRVAGEQAEPFAFYSIGTMREQKLLFQVLDSDGMDDEVKHWLDDMFGVHELGGDMKNKHLKFKQYDPLSFVVTILNFLRGDTAPLLAPSVERSQTISHPSPASARVKKSATGEEEIGGVSRVTTPRSLVRMHTTKQTDFTCWTEYLWPEEHAMTGERVVNKVGLQCACRMFCAISCARDKCVSSCPSSLCRPGSRFGCPSMPSVPTWKPHEL